MKNSVHFVIICALWLGVLTIERAVGLPVMTLFSAAVFIHSLPWRVRVVGWVAASWVVASFYQVPVWLLSGSFLGLLALLAVSDQVAVLRHRERSVLLGAVWLCLAGLERLLELPWTSGQMAYHLFVTLIVWWWGGYWFGSETTQARLQLSRFLQKGGWRAPSN